MSADRERCRCRVVPGAAKRVVDREPLLTVCSAVNTHRAALGIVVSLAIGMSARAQAGSTKPAPPINPASPPPPLADKEFDDLPAPRPETVARASPVEMPAIPNFRLPASEAGFHGPRELQVRGALLLGTEIKVKGYVTWIYDCTTALAAANPKASPADLRQAIQAHPALCENPKLYLGDARDTPRNASIWVVDLPGDLRRLAVGDAVVVTGTWAQRSSHAEHHSGGLLVFKAVEPVAPGPVAVETAADDDKPVMELAIDGTAATPMRKIVDPEVRDRSIVQLNACNHALADKHYDDALAACDDALKIWDGNHLAWYATAAAHMARAAWPEAHAAIERAVALRPDFAMYQLYNGMALYETARLAARDDQARLQHKRPGDLALDAPTVIAALRGSARVVAARDALLRAVRVNHELWRAHYYLGRVYRDLDDDRRAASQFTQAVQTNPGYRFAYLALVELYRRWGYLEPSLVVASIGVTRVAAAETADLWLEVGLAYDAKAVDDKAIVALGNAIAIRPSDANAKLQRGRIFFRLGDTASARRDLEDVARATDPRLDAARQLASQMLVELAAGVAADSTGCAGSHSCGIRTAPSSRWGGADPIDRM
jgi:tetratricopeptide (TPR) repeat protein